MKRADTKEPRENVEPDRVRKRTAQRANREIDRRTRASLLLHADEPEGEVARRIRALQLPVLRRVFGFRTRREVDRERYALKALRGDFEELDTDAGDLGRRIDAVLGAVGRTGGADPSAS